jgi:hypothetical protein
MVPDHPTGIKMDCLMQAMFDPDGFGCRLRLVVKSFLGLSG